MARPEDAPLEILEVTIEPESPGLPGGLLFVHENIAEPCRIRVRFSLPVPDTVPLQLHLRDSRTGQSLKISDQDVAVDAQGIAAVVFENGFEVGQADTVEALSLDTRMTTRIPAVGQTHAVPAILSLLHQALATFQPSPDSPGVLADNHGRTLQATVKARRDTKYDYERRKEIERIEIPPQKYTFFSKFMNPDAIHAEHHGYVRETTVWREHVVRQYDVVGFEAELAIRDHLIATEPRTGLRFSRNSLPTYVLPSDVAIGPKYRLAVQEHAVPTVDLLDEQLLGALEAFVWTTTFPLVLNRDGLASSCISRDARSFVAFVEMFVCVSDILRRRAAAGRVPNVTVRPL